MAKKKPEALPPYELMMSWVRRVGGIQRSGQLWGLVVEEQIIGGASDNTDVIPEVYARLHEDPEPIKLTADRLRERAAELDAVARHIESWASKEGDRNGDDIDG